MIADKTLLNLIYENLIFDFRIWNKAEYEIRIGHIQYISTIIKDDKKYFRKKYGIQFFLDVIKTYFGSSSGKFNESNMSEMNGHSISKVDMLMNDEDMRNLRSSFFGLIKYYAQKDIRIDELNTIMSFLANSHRNSPFQSDVLDMLIALADAPNNASDQLILRLFEPNVADGFYALLAQPDLDRAVQHRLMKLIRILLKTKKVYEKSKVRMWLEDCGGYAGKLVYTFLKRSYNKLKNKLIIY